MKKLALIVLLMLLGVALAGCAGSGSKTQATTAASKAETRTPSNHNSPLVVAMKHARLGSRLGRLHSPTRLAIATIGSSGCPTQPKRLIVQRPDTIEIRLKVKNPPNGTNGICFADAHLTRYVLSINPSQINVHHRLTIRLDYPQGVISQRAHPVIVTAAPL